MSSRPAAIPSHSRRKTSSSRWSRLYLTVYNLILTTVWSNFMWTLVKAVLDAPHIKNPSLVVKHLAWDLCWVQAAAFPEIIHSALGLVSSGVATCLMQWATRMFAILFGCVTLARNPSVRLDPIISWAFVAMGAAWSLADVTRYLFYVDAIWRQQTARPNLIKKLRYTLFIVLYPIGVVSEMLLVNTSRIVYLSFNPNWPFNPAILGCLALYPFGFTYLYIHMLRQRSRQLKSHTN